MREWYSSGIHVVVLYLLLCDNWLLFIIFFFLVQLGNIQDFNSLYEDGVGVSSGCLRYVFFLFQAVAMDTTETGSQTSSMVDDSFFIVKKCVRLISAWF